MTASARVIPTQTAMSRQPRMRVPRKSYRSSTGLRESVRTVKGSCCMDESFSSALAPVANTVIISNSSCEVSHSFDGTDAHLEVLAVHVIEDRSGRYSP